MYIVATGNAPTPPHNIFHQPLDHVVDMIVSQLLDNVNML